MRAVSLLALAALAQSAAAFAPIPARGLPARFAAAPLSIKPVPRTRAGLQRTVASVSARTQYRSVGERLASSAEVAVSKIFPAGAGWQTASIVAGKMGLGSTSLAFFLTVGMGDLLGVFIGHTLYQILKKKLTNDASIKVRDQVQVATLLGGAAFFSGSTWQPALNAATALGLGFNGAFLAVGVACTMAFYAGLRVFRHLLSPTMGAVERNSYANLKADTQLSIAIGAATAFFVGTDVSFGAANWLAGIVGIADGLSDVAGICLAGLSTALGFMAAQLAMSVGLAKNKCWIDPQPEFSN